MHQQQQRARAAWKGSGEEDIASRFQGLLEDGLKSEFFGYTALTGVGRVVALLADAGLPVDALPSGSLGYVVASAATRDCSPLRLARPRCSTP